MEENINALDELNKGACMGMDAIKFIIDKVDSKKFKDGLLNQYKKYEDISLKINNLYSRYNDTDTPHETNALEKVMTWYGIEMKTITDHSDSKIAELLLKGTNMGIIEGRRLLNHKEVDKTVHELIDEYVTMQEDSANDLKIIYKEW